MHLQKILLLSILAISGIMAAPVANSGTTSHYIPSTFLSLISIQMPSSTVTSTRAPSTAMKTQSVHLPTRTLHINLQPLIRSVQALLAVPREDLRSTGGGLEWALGSCGGDCEASVFGQRGLESWVIDEGRRSAAVRMGLWVLLRLGLRFDTETSVALTS